jgi:ZIP family zinc transporter
MGEKNMTPVNTTIIGLIIPFSGTALGAAMVFFLKNSMSEKLEKSLMGFAAGVMIAASVWSLLIPAMEMATGSGNA